MFLQQRFLLLSFVTLSCVWPLTFAQPQLRLHPAEVVVLQKIAEKMGAALKQNLTEDPCQLGRLPIDDAEEPADGRNNTINCTLTGDGDGFLHITHIQLKFLSLQGALPQELVNLSYLEEIDLSYNYLSGTLPEEWASMQHLNQIYLTANNLSGEIPAAWGYITSLTELSVEANKLSGHLPMELGNLVNLTKLELSSNQFSGSLPATLGKLKNMKKFRISDNSFSGPVPEFIGTWTNLQMLEMYSSGLEGPIPDAIFFLRNLSDLRITDMIGPSFSFPNLTNKGFTNLVLRNLNMSGSVPTNVFEATNIVDLTFNKLEGKIQIPNDAKNPNYMFLSGNMINGNIPETFLSTTKPLDLSYNNFTPPSSCPDNGKLNLYRSFSSNNNTSGNLSCPSRSSCEKYHRSLHINCGGTNETVNNTLYEGDRVAGDGATLNYDSGTNWGFISAGVFMDKKNEHALSTNYYRYAVSTKYTSSMSFPKLYSTARATPLFLTYYAYCLENGNYTVNLHFAEILFRDEEAYNRGGRRIFDIYIQGRLEWKDFNIMEIANGTGKEIMRSFNATVTDHTLEIRLYWAGKGTTGIPIRGIYGPLISAISVCHGIKSYCDGDSLFSDPKRSSNVRIVVGVVTLVVSLVLCAVGVICWRHYCRQKNTIGLKGLDRQTCNFTYRQLKAATNNFDSTNKIGVGGFGYVYKGQLSDGTSIAVKQLSSKSRQGKREFVNEIGMISGLQHPNLVKLFGCCVEGNELLLVYEYMENNSLAHALFGSESNLRLNWATRQKICVGIARGLAFLHNGSTLRIVHRDIKATNVVLDKELNAKISDFGLAKLKDEENTHISTRVAGTIGYMAPEYALWGSLTEKADVYSFGVVALEIVSGRRNASYRAQNACFSLLDYAFDLQQKGNLMELMDPKLECKFNKKEAEKMIKVALLCSNATPSLRPTMSEVISMLEAKTIVHEVISDPSIYGVEFQLKPLEDRDQEIGEQSSGSGGSLAPNFSSDKTRVGSSTTSAHYLYPVHSETIYL